MSAKTVTGAGILLFFTVLALFPNLIAPGDPGAGEFETLLGPSGDHLLGTTAFGQDVFVQVVHGTRPALLIALVAGLFATLLAVVLGVSAAYIGGWWDRAINLVTDVFLIIPILPLTIVLAAYFSNRSSWVLILVLVVTGWSYGARQLRSQALTLRDRDFLQAAKVRGEHRFYIIVFELLPNMASLIAGAFLTSALYALLTAAGLQFLGLGDTDTIDWGTMLFWAQNNAALQTGQYAWAAAPGFCVAALAAAFALLNNAFDEIGNPALRPVRRRVRAA
jgi:peptide/nickel transport system permease protein